MRIVLLLSILLGLPNAFASEKTEVVSTWLSKSQFDGKVFRYQYKMYEASQIVSEEIKVSCEMGKFGAQPVLSAVRVEILVGAKFDSPGQELTRSGRVDVRREIGNCLKKLPQQFQLIKAPVRIVLPQVSVPTHQ